MLKTLIATDTGPRRPAGPGKGPQGDTLLAPMPALIPNWTQAPDSPAPRWPGYANGKPTAAPPVEIEARHFDFYYGAFQALGDINLVIPRHHITALIGPSGCGKSTFLRAINRMYDAIPGAEAEGELLLGGTNVVKVENLVELRKRVGMIFQRPNPFPMSIFDNVAYGLRLEAQGAGRRSPGHEFRSASSRRCSTPTFGMK